MRRILLSSISTENASLEVETSTYISRVALGGGIITDIDYVDSIYKKLKELGILNNLIYWNSANAGVNIDGSKLYSLDINNNDAGQSDASFKPIFKNSNVNPSKKSFYFDNKVIYGQFASFLSSEYTLIDLSVFEGNTKTTQHGLTTATGNATYLGASIEYWEGNKTIVYIGNGSSFEVAGFDYVFDLNSYITKSIRRNDSSLVYNEELTENMVSLTNNYSTSVNDYSIGSRSSIFGYDNNYMVGEINETICFDVSLTNNQNLEVRNLISDYYSS